MKRFYVGAGGKNVLLTTFGHQRYVALFEEVDNMRMHPSIFVVMIVHILNHVTYSSASNKGWCFGSFLWRSWIVILAKYDFIEYQV